MSHLGYLTRKHNVGQEIGPRHRACRSQENETLRKIRRDNHPATTTARTIGSADANKFGAGYMQTNCSSRVRTQ